MELLCASMFNSSELNTPAIIHGKTWESTAIKTFEKSMDVQVERCGLFVSSKHPFLGASPDGIIGTDCVIEVKCPFNGRNSKIGLGKSFPFLTKEGEDIVLKRNHRYYYQVMGQLAITDRKYCYFVVYTYEDLHVQKIEYDASFFNDSVLPKLAQFYQQHYLPYVASQL